MDFLYVWMSTYLNIYKVMLRACVRRYLSRPARSISYTYTRLGTPAMLVITSDAES